MHEMHAMREKEVMRVIYLRSGWQVGRASERVCSRPKGRRSGDGVVLRLHLCVGRVFVIRALCEKARMVTGEGVQSGFQGNERGRAGEVQSWCLGAWRLWRSGHVGKGRGSCCTQGDGEADDGHGILGTGVCLWADRRGASGSGGWSCGFLGQKGVGEGSEGGG